MHNGGDLPPVVVAPELGGLEEVLDQMTEFIAPNLEALDQWTQELLAFMGGTREAPPFPLDCEDWSAWPALKAEWSGLRTVRALSLMQAGRNARTLRTVAEMGVAHNGDFQKTLALYESQMHGMKREIMDSLRKLGWDPTEVLKFPGDRSIMAQLQLLVDTQYESLEKPPNV